MANPYVITMPDVQAGTAFLWPHLLAPADGQIMLVDANGLPVTPSASQWTANIKGNPIQVGQQFWDGANVETCIFAGTAGSGSEPTWPVPPSFFPLVNVTTATTVDGTVKWCALGPPYSAGGTEGTAEVTIETKEQPILIDQSTMTLDVFMTGQDAMISVTLKESAMRKVMYAMPGGIFSSGTNVGLPAGAQTYEELAFGGLQPPGTIFPGVGWCVGLIAPRRGFSAPGKYIYVVLYNAYTKGPFKIAMGRDKQSIYKVDFIGMGQPGFRTLGSQLCQVVRQT
jgi:hypothetical protein